jgi:primosomal protein N' (replication factor Y)
VSPSLQARVAPPLPVDGLYSYAVPEALASRVRPGVRARIPFHGRSLTAMVVAVDDEPPPPGVTLKPIQGLVEDEPLVGSDVLELASWIARTTLCSVGEALDAALPAAVKKGKRNRSEPRVRLAVPEEAVKALVDELQEKREKQARTLRILADRGGDLALRELTSLARVSRSPVDSLVKLGHVTVQSVVVDRDPLTADPVARGKPHELTDDQRAACEHIDGTAAAGGGRVVLLHGVTGSGKTEVYLQCLGKVVEGGRQGIVLVPEISLTPQTVRRFRERFDRVAVLHSRLTDAERNDQWRRIRRGEADVVVGARSAIFAPVPKLGLVIIDEEHESSFKQQSVPRYHARDVAVERARLCDAAVVLGTATPSLEAWQRAQSGTYELVTLPQRVAGGRSPEMVLVDLTVEERRKGFTYITDPLRLAMEEAFKREGQVILFLNRRGWATVLLCRTCRTSLKCPHCEVSMTLHRRVDRVLCHYCGHEQQPPAACPDCSTRLQPLGFGTEKVEDEVRRLFSGVNVARMDSDTMSARGAHATVLDAFAAGDVHVLVGTQMIAKGLDFPNALLVGVICGDSALFLPDYRASERTFQLVAQVAGRTGRGPKGGRVVVQAYDIHHPAIRTGVSQDYATFARGELMQREELGYPPYGRLVRIVVQGKDLDATRERARELGERLHGSPPPKPPAPVVTEALLPGMEAMVEAHAAPDAPRGAGPIPGVMLLGPAPAPIPRIDERHRLHLVAKCETDAAVDAVLARLAGQVAPKRDLRVLVDVDPLSML